MRNLKLSFAFVIAIAAVGITIASKAGQIGSRVLTACFEQVSLQNAAGTVFDSPVVGQDCSTVLADLGSAVYLRTNPATGANIKTDCEDALPIYCCIEFEIDLSAPATVPNTTPGGAPSGKYKVENILCRPRP